MFIIYGKENCSQCDQSKMLLKMKGEDFKYLQLGVDYDIEDLRCSIPESCKSFPIIFKNTNNFIGEYVGGLKELKEHFK